MRFLNQKNIFIICAGALLEYYDFIIFGLLATYLSTNFFISFSNGLILSYLLFAAGYVFRPIGGIILGAVSDLKGRKKVFSAITILTGLATLLIGLLPPARLTYGISTILLVFLRIFQSIGYGAEIPNAVTIMYESSSNKRGSIKISLIIVSATIGSLLAMGSLYLLTRFFNKNEMLEFGWRIPFILGGALSLLLYSFRKNLLETVNTEGHSSARYHFDKLRNFFRQIFGRYKLNSLKSFCIILPATSFVILNIFLPVYLNKYFHYQTSEIYYATTLGLVLCLGALLLSGFIIERFKISHCITIATILVATAIIYVCLYRQFSNINDVYIFIAVYNLYDGFMIVLGLSVAAKIFPPHIRNTAIAVIYNGAFLLASLIPTIVIKLSEIYKNPLVFYYILLFLLVSLGIVGSYLFLKLDKHNEN